MKINLTFKDTASPQLQRLASALDARGMERVHRVAGDRLKDELQDHFRQKATEPNKRGAQWSGRPRFWERMHRATALIAANAKKAVVTVADPAYRARVYGATIRAKSAKYLAIPIYKRGNEQYAGVRPRAVFERDQLFTWRSKSGKLYIARDQRGEGGRLSLFC